MSKTMTVSERVTYRYRDGWDYLDQWGNAFEVKVLGAPKMVREPEDYDDGGDTRYWIQAPKGLTKDERQQLMQAVRDTMGGSYCRHEYDCCGCASSHVSVRHVKGRMFTALIHTSYNY